ncbi:MAG: molybdopterin-guanine dinucleotide biosynthesis protein B [Bacillota bacterium]
MTAMLAVVGWSNSGKTTFITKLIPELKQRGYKIATIKHNAHKFKIDKPGKDSWRHRQAGAETVVLSSVDKVAVIKEVEQEIKVKQLVEQYIADEFDLVIIEGYKTGDTPKIEVFRPESYEQPVLEETQVLKRIINNFAEPEGIAAEAAAAADLIERELFN